MGQCQHVTWPRIHLAETAAQVHVKTHQGRDRKGMGHCQLITWPRMLRRSMGKHPNNWTDMSWGTINLCQGQKNTGEKNTAQVHGRAPQREDRNVMGHRHHVPRPGNCWAGKRCAGPWENTPQRRQKSDGAPPPCATARKPLSRETLRRSMEKHPTAKMEM